MADELELSAPLDLETGLCVYKGVTYTLKELTDLWELEEHALQDEAALLRDYTRDDLNMWGSKANHFVDDRYYRKKPLRRQKGYPRDCSPQTQ